MEIQAEQEQNLNIKQKYVAELDQSKIDLSNPTGQQGEGKYQETGIQTKLDKYISPRMEVIETKLLLHEVKIRNQKAGELANVEQANDALEQKTALVPNSRQDKVGLISPRYVKSSDSCLMSPRSNSKFIHSSHSCAEEIATIGPTSECRKINMMKKASITNGPSCRDNKKILNFADVNTLKLATLIQSMMVDVLKLTQNVNNSQVSIEGFSFKVSVDIRNGKQESVDSTNLNDRISSISKQLAFHFKEASPAIADKQELNSITIARKEKQLLDEILPDDPLLVVEDEQEMSNLADSVCSDDTLTLENVISVVDITCYDELNKQELHSVCNTSIEELPQDEIFYDNKLELDKDEEMSSMVNTICSDDTLTLENGISVADVIFNRAEQIEAKAVEATSTKKLPQNELVHGNTLLVVEEEKISSMVDDMCSDDTYNDEFHNQELKAIATPSIEELPQDEILHGDQLLANNKEEENSSVAERVDSNNTLIVENGMSIQDLKCNGKLPYKDENENSTIQLNLGFEKMVTIAPPQLNEEFIEIATSELNNELIQMTTIQLNNELCEIKSKDEVKECSAVKLSDEKDSTTDVNEPTPSEHSTLKIELSISKYCSITEDFLKNLRILNDSSNNGPMKSSVMVPAFYFRSWYFHNIRQGFLLNIMLRKANVSTLNYMRNLYFVIITTDSHSITIAINFALQNEIFLHFNERSIYFNDDCCKYTVSAKEIQQIFSPETGIVESCTTYEESNSNNANIQSHSDLTSIYSALLAEKINAATSYLYFDLFDELQRIDVAVGESNFELQADIKLCGINKSHCKTWLTSLLNVPKRKIGTFFIHDVNETVFEQFSVDRYMKAAFGKGNSNFSSSAGNSNFYNIFFKCFGHTIACTMLSFFISML